LEQLILTFRPLLSDFSNRFFKFILFFLVLCTFYLIPFITNAAQVTLSWDASVGSVTGYKIHYGTKSRDYDFSIDVGNFTSCTISGLEEGTTFYFAATAYDDIDESDYSAEIAYTMPIENFGDTIPLPSADAYGNIISGDQSHIDEVNYSFGGLSGDVMLYYEAWDVDNASEVEIILNGTHIGYPPVTGNESWGGLQAITLPDALVNDSSNNYLTFNNTFNPPNQYYWGMRNVSAGVP
jgi:hypothetical protein